MMTHVMADGTTKTYKAHRKSVGRNLIRKISFNEEDRIFGVGDPVLIVEQDLVTNEYIPISYIASVVTAVTETGVSIRMHDRTGGQDAQANIPIENVMLEAESSEFIMSAGTSLSVSEMVEALETSVHAVGFGLEGSDDDSYIKVFEVGKGAIVTVVSSMGNAVLKWDGLNRVEVNLFKYEEDDVDARLFKHAFLSKFKHMGIVAQDAFPRGYGKVVNTKDEMKRYRPHWMLRDNDGEEYDDEDEDDDEDYDDDDDEDFDEDFDE